MFNKRNMLTRQSKPKALHREYSSIEISFLITHHACECGINGRRQVVECRDGIYQKQGDRDRDDLVNMMQ